MSSKSLTVWRILLALAITVALALFWSIPFRIGQFCQYLDSFSGDIVREDQLAASDDLSKIYYFVELNKKLKPLQLDGVADKYLFKGLLHYESAYDYLTGNYPKIIKSLESDESYWGRYIRANSNWRLAQGIYKESLKMDAKTKAEMQKQAMEMAYATKDDYEEVIKNDPDSSLPPKWNYDLTTDPAAMMRALMPKPAKIKVVLGEGGPKNKGSGEDKGKGPKGGGIEDLNIEGPQKQGRPKPHNERPG